MPAAATTRTRPPAKKASETKKPPAPDLRVVPARAPREAKVSHASDGNAQHFAVCHALGHSWQHVGPADADVKRPKRAGGAFGWISRCSHCGTKRTRWMTRYGNVVPMDYDYPDGYVRTGEERLTRQEWRRTWVVSAGLG